VFILGKLYVVGIGPGGLDHMTVKAVKVLEESEVIVGYTKYIELIEPLIKDKTIVSTGMRGEVEYMEWQGSYWN
jgi:precorrin-3B C17-methyltransferase